VTNVGYVTAALLFVAPAYGQQMTGGTGTFSGSSSSSSGMGRSGSGGNSTSNNFSIDTQEISQGIIGQSLLGGFDNVGQGMGRSAQASVVSATNPLAAYYVNPLSQGLMSGTGTSSMTSASFGTPLFGNLATGTTGATTNRGGSGSAFGGTSTSSLGSFGGIGSSTSRGGTTGLTGTATIRGGTTGTIAPGFNGGTWGPAIGRRGPVMAASLRSPARPIPLMTRRPDLQAIIARSTVLSSAGNITVSTDGNVVVLTGSVASEDDRRIAENMLRLSPGVRELRNELQVRP
jgi:hypothetical protein